MLLSKRQAGEAETEWFGKARVKGPVGLVVFVVGVALLILTTRQLAGLPVESSDGTPTPSVGYGDLPGGTGSATAAISAPAKDYQASIQQDVVVTGNVTGLGNSTLWILAQHENGRSYYLLSDGRVTKDGLWRATDHHVGNDTDRNTSFTYFAVEANDDCDKALAAKGDRGFRSLPPGCTPLAQRLIHIK